MLKVLAQCR